jgi:hypothetical protein
VVVLVPKVVDLNHLGLRLLRQLFKPGRCHGEGAAEPDYQLSSSSPISINDNYGGGGGRAGAGDVTINCYITCKYFFMTDMYLDECSCQFEKVTPYCDVNDTFRSTG